MFLAGPRRPTKVEMGKKLEALAGSLVDSELSVKVRDSANQLWRRSSSAYSSRRPRAKKAFNALVKDGEIVQARTRKLADETIANVTGKAVTTWTKIERAVEHRIPLIRSITWGADQAGYQQAVEERGRVDRGRSATGCGKSEAKGARLKRRSADANILFVVDRRAQPPVWRADAEGRASANRPLSSAVDDSRPACLSVIW